MCCACALVGCPLHMAAALATHLCKSGMWAQEIHRSGWSTLRMLNQTLSVLASSRISVLSWLLLSPCPALSSLAYTHLHRQHELTLSLRNSRIQFRPPHRTPSSPAAANLSPELNPHSRTILASQCASEHDTLPAFSFGVGQDITPSTIPNPSSTARAHGFLTFPSLPISWLWRPFSLDEATLTLTKPANVPWRGFRGKPPKSPGRWWVRGRWTGGG